MTADVRIPMLLSPFLITRLDDGRLEWKVAPKVVSIRRANLAADVAEYFRRNGTDATAGEPTVEISLNRAEDHPEGLQVPHLTLMRLSTIHVPDKGLAINLWHAAWTLAGDRDLTLITDSCGNPLAGPFNLRAAAKALAAEGFALKTGGLFARAPECYDPGATYVPGSRAGAETPWNAGFPNPRARRLFRVWHPATQPPPVEYLQGHGVEIPEPYVGQRYDPEPRPRRVQVAPNQYPDHVQTWPSADGTWQVSDGGGWIDGYFDSEATALAAVPYAGSAALADLSKRVCHFDKEDRAITAADLATLGVTSDCGRCGLTLRECRYADRGCCPYCTHVTHRRHTGSWLPWSAARRKFGAWLKVRRGPPMK